MKIRPHHRLYAAQPRILVYPICLALLVCACDRERDEDEFPAPVVANEPAWFPSGGRLVYTDHTEIPPRLRSVDTLGVAQPMFANWPYEARLGDVSPDGKALLFVSQGMVYRALLTTAGAVIESSITALTTRGRSFFPRWSPDQREIVYDSDVEGDTIGFYGICFMDTDGSNKRRISPTAGDARRPDWSPSMDRIVFYGYVANDKPDILITDTSGVLIRQVTSDDEFDTDPGWSPDGAGIAFCRDGEIVLTDTTAVRIESLSTGRHPAWSPDARNLAYVAVEPGGKYVTIYSLNLSTRRQRQLVSRKE